MSISDDVREVFHKLPEVFVPEKAENLNASIQIELSGEGASAWVIKIGNGELKVEEGSIAQPDMILQMDAKDYLALTKGNANPMALFAAGRIKFQGDMGLALKFQQLFKRP